MRTPSVLLTERPVPSMGGAYGRACDAAARVTLAVLRADDPGQTQAHLLRDRFVRVSIRREAVRVGGESRHRGRRQRRKERR
jgi:hypothetical protein